MSAEKMELRDRPYIKRESNENQCMKLLSTDATFAPSSSFSEESLGSQVRNVERNDSQWSSSTKVHTLSGLYAVVLSVFVGISVFTELLHGPVPLFYIHVYLFLYLFGISILLLCISFASWFKSKYLQTAETTVKVQTCGYALSAKGFCFGITNLYLKLGIVVFGVGFFVSTCLEIAAIFTSSTQCMSVVSAIVPVFRCLFIILLTICLVSNPKGTNRIRLNTHLTKGGNNCESLVKHLLAGYHRYRNIITLLPEKSQVFIKVPHILELFGSYGCFCHLVVMHITATVAAVWIQIFLWESNKDWQDALHFKHNSSSLWEQNEINISVHSLDSDANSMDMNKHLPLHTVHFTSNCWWRTSEYQEVIDTVAIQMCLLNSTVGNISEKAATFLYPFTSQYCFVVVCVLYLIWEESRPDTKKCSFTSYVPYDRDNNGICNRSTKGLFCGFLILVASIIITIMFLTSRNMNYIVLRSIYCIIFILSFCASILGLTQVKRMSVSKCNCRTRFIKLFQISGIISVYIYGSCNIIVGALSDDTISILISCEAILMMLHASTQYVFIFEVSRKRIDNSNMYVKPGRQVVFFLAFCNISLWLLDCFILWNHAKSDLQVKFYGNIAWPIIMRLVIPFLVYFRFYSASVLLQAWIVSY